MAPRYLLDERKNETSGFFSTGFDQESAVRNCINALLINFNMVKPFQERRTDQSYIIFDVWKKKKTIQLKDDFEKIQ